MIVSCQIALSSPRREAIATSALVGGPRAFFVSTIGGMRTRTITSNNLADAIKRYAPQPMTDADAADGARNLAGFFQLLIKIKNENQKQGK